LKNTARLGEAWLREKEREKAEKEQKETKKEN